jgi:hypothetical protein
MTMKNRRSHRLRRWVSMAKSKGRIEVGHATYLPYGRAPADGQLMAPFGEQQQLADAKEAASYCNIQRV